MKKSELKKLISETVRRKLNESRGQQVASKLNDIIQGGDVKEVKILTHYGSHDLEIIEVYSNNGVLYLTVNADPAQPNQ
jgi:hypothetical protein